jgi:probable F420-dependent oxidoreductase
VRLGILLSFQAPPSFGQTPEAAYRAAIDQAVEAEALGFSSAWVTEHHFNDDGYLPSPLIACTAIAARTTTLRVGQAVLLLPLRNPVRLAEDLAVLDVLSGGRLDVGVGMGYRDAEYLGTGVPVAQRRARFEEGLEILHRAWAGDTFDYDGRCFTLRGVRVRPRPLQRPHPPLWFGAKSVAGLRRAAAYNAAFLLPMTPPLADVSEQAAAFRRALEAAGHAGREATIALMREVWVAESTDAAWAEIGDAFRYTYTRTYGPQHIPYHDGLRRIESPDDPFLMSPGFRTDRMIYGDPDAVVGDIHRFVAATGATELICRFALPGLPHDRVLASMRRFAHDVMPRLT